MQYLSDAWIEAADAAVSELDPTGEPFAASYIISDGPTGEHSYTLTLGPEVSIRAGTGAPVVLHMSWSIAHAIATSQLSAQRAFLDGDIRIEGDAQALLGHRDALIAADQRLADLRSRTRF